MTFLVLGLLLFLGVHSVRIVAEPWRQQTLARIGPGAWKGLYSLASAVGLGLIIWGYGQARAEPVMLWTPQLWARHLGFVLTLVSFVLLAAAYVPGNHLKAAVKHPMVLGVKVWARWPTPCCSAASWSGPCSISGRPDSAIAPRAPSIPPVVWCPPSSRLWPASSPGRSSPWPCIAC